MDSFAFLSVLLIPFLMGIGILGYLAWQLYKDRKAEGRRTRWSHLLFAALFWLVFLAYFVWRSQAG